MLMNGFDGQITTARSSRIGERREKIRVRPGRVGAGEREFAKSTGSQRSRTK